MKIRVLYNYLLNLMALCGMEYDVCLLHQTRSTIGIGYHCREVESISVTTLTLDLFCFDAMQNVVNQRKVTF